MLLTANSFADIGSLLRRHGGEIRQRQLKVDVTLATASGDLIDGRIHHFARGGVELIAAAPLQSGDRFGFKVTATGGTHFLFCEVLACRPNEQAFVVRASFLTQEFQYASNCLHMAN